MLVEGSKDRPIVQNYGLTYIKKSKADPVQISTSIKMEGIVLNLPMVYPLAVGNVARRP